VQRKDWPGAETRTEVARRAEMEETRSKRDCPGSSNTVLDSARERYDHRYEGNCFIDSCEQVQTGLPTNS
jgi:hypothetical protein